MTSGGYHLLLVDNDFGQLNAVAEYLRLAGFRITTTTDGLAAVRLFEEMPIDLVLVDIRIAGYDGFQTISAIRSHSKNSEVPIIVISSFDRPNLKIKALEMGADDYVVKPVNLAELRARINAVLRRSERFRKIAGALAGDFAEIPPSVLIQTMALGERTAEIRPEVGGAILMVRGLFCDARWRSLAGEPALQRLCLLNSGRFKTLFDQPKLNGKNGKPAAAVLLNIFASLDEVFGVISVVGGVDAILRPKHPGFALNGLTLPIEFTPRQWLLDFPGSLSDGTELLVAAWRSGQLIC